MRRAMKAATRTTPRLGRPPLYREAMGTVSIRLSLDTLTDLGRMSHARRVSVSDVARELIVEGLAKRGERPAAGRGTVAKGER